jgi:hypothetical protein
VSARPILKFDEASYKILVREGCRLVHGRMPLNEFLHLLKQASDSALGATAVIGSPQALARLRKQEAPAAIERAFARSWACARAASTPMPSAGSRSASGGLPASLFLRCSPASGHGTAEARH